VMKRTFPKSGLLWCLAVLATAAVVVSGAPQTPQTQPPPQQPSIITLTITGAEVEKTSGYTALDIAALRAVLGARQLPPLPAGYPNPSLGVHLNFQYTR